MALKNPMLVKFSAYGFLKNLQFFEPFLILFFRANHLSFFQIGLLISIREISIELFEIPTGIIADVSGKRRSMVFAFIGYIISFIAFYLAGGTFWIYTVAMIVFALGEAFRTGTHKAIILDYLDKTGKIDQKVAYYGTTRSFSKLGSALSSLMAAMIVFLSGGYNYIFLFSIIPYIGGLLLMLSYPKDINLKQDTSVKQLAKDFIAHTKSSFKSMFRIPGLARALVHSSAYEGIFKTAKDYLQPLIKQQAVLLPVFIGLAAQQRTALLIGITYSLINLAAALSSKKSAWVASKFKASCTVLNMYMLLTVVLFIGIAFSIKMSVPIPAILGFIAVYMIQNLRKPLMIGNIAEKMEKKERATILSVDSQLKSFFAMLVAPLFGLLADNYGLYSAFIMGAFLLLLLYVSLRIKNKPVKC